MEERLGLVLGGGAVRGAFQAGVVSALDRAGVEFHAIVGTSVGAVNGAALLLGHGPRLCEMWVESLHGIAWLDPARLLRGRSPFLISEAMRTLVGRYGDIPRIRGHATEMLVSVTEWDTGRNVLFSNKDTTDWTDEERVLQFLASLTIPFVCTERIVIRGRRYCDGGLSCNLPLEPLVARGCTRIVVVDPSPVAVHRAFARVARPLAARLGALPHPLARLAAGLVRGALAPAPLAAGGVSIRVVRPPRPLDFAALDFRSLDRIRRALDDGLATGERLAAELTRTAFAPPPPRSPAPR